MNSDSQYLNPFQPFPERYKAGEVGEERLGTAIEDNLSRSVFSALRNANSAKVVATFLRNLGKHGSTALQQKVTHVAAVIEAADHAEIRFGLQTWPAAALRDRTPLPVILVGISSSHQRAWTHDCRCAPDAPRPDAWIYLPGKMLLVFECKNDENPLDATQISAYAHHLGIIAESENVPKAGAGLTLISAAEADAVRQACADVVLDVPWATVVDALVQIHQDLGTNEIGRWLCGQAAEYIRWHVRPPYRGVDTILEWLAGPDTSDRRDHLRTLIRKMAAQLANSAAGTPHAITFALDDDQKGDLAVGAGSAVYVKLKRGGEFLQVPWLGRPVNAVLWFDFAEDENQRVGMEFYLQSPGSHPAGKGDPESDWNRASDRHLASAQSFEKNVAEWASKAPAQSQVVVSAVRFKGKKRNWQGGGTDDSDALNSIRTSPEGALAFLQTHREELWRFPRVGLAGTFRSIPDAAAHVRKPALSLIVPLLVGNLKACGEDDYQLQNVLQAALAGSFVTNN